MATGLLGQELRMTGRILADFIGPWRLERRIEHADGTQARFTGQALWQPEGTGALYLETGDMRLDGGAVFRAERRYRWDAGLNVFFDDGRFFHTVPPQGGAAAHWCAPDQYDVEYDFGQWSGLQTGWQTRWRVRGPRKDYLMTSDYCR